MCGREEECRVYYYGVLLWGSRFDSRTVHLEFVAYKVALRHTFCHIFHLLSIGIMLSVFHTYNYICHECYIILALNRGRLVNPVMWGISELAEKLWASQAGLVHCALCILFV
jgi:hypothetical protein